MKMRVIKGSQDNLLKSLEQINKHGYQIPGLSESSKKNSKEADVDFDEFFFDSEDFDD